MWLGLLFSTIGIAASDFFCINLSSIATLLGLSENLAGVTFLAFGNGSPDVFSTFAAMSSNSGSLAVGELIGAAGFITAVVAGSMAFVQPFKVAKKSFVRDVSFFIVATCFTLVFLHDGKIWLWESMTMVVVYIIYVVFVVTWHWWLTRKRKRRLVEAAARSQYIIPGSGTEDLGEQYRDDDEDRDIRDMASSRATLGEDFSALEAGNLGNNDDDEDADDDARGRFLGEINKNMRLSRPKPSDKRHTQNPIRPSLVGALEFRSVMASLRKSRNLQSYQLDHQSHNRRYSDAGLLMAQERRSTISAANESSTAEAAPDSSSVRPRMGRTASGNRARAISAVEPGAPPAFPVPRIDLLGPLPDEDSPSIEPQPSQASLFAPPSPSISISPPPSADLSRAASPAPGHERTLDRLAPPNLTPNAPHSTSGSTDAAHQSNWEARGRTSPGQLRVSTDFTQSTEGTEFPIFTDTNLYASPTSSQSPSPQPRRVDSARNGRLVDLPVEERISRPIAWWPNKILPPPQVLYCTLFPTLSSWAEKCWWERCLGVVAAPSVFLLTITLPVVEIQREEEEKEDTLPINSDGSTEEDAALESLADRSLRQDSRRITPPAGYGHIHTEHQHSKSIGSHSNGSPAMTPGTGRTGIVSIPTRNPTDPPNPSISEIQDADDWNRWLVILQTFTAPFFIVLILWANMHASDTRWLLRSSLISLVVSLVLLAFILTTTTPERPPKWHAVLCFLGFVVSIAWISTIAGEVVGVLKTIGVVLNISDAILGLTIFAVGNSLGDLVADITVAKLGYPVMALSACFGGPMLNILLGIGLGGMYMTITGAQHSHKKHPGKKMKFKPYIVEVDRTLMISGVALLVTLVALLIVVPLRKWRMDRVVAWGLISLWVVATVGNVGVEIWLGNGLPKDA